MKTAAMPASIAVASDAHAARAARPLGGRRLRPGRSDRLMPA